MRTVQASLSLVTFLAPSLSLKKRMIRQVKSVAAPSPTLGGAERCTVEWLQVSMMTMENIFFPFQLPST